MKTLSALLLLALATGAHAQATIDVPWHPDESDAEHRRANVAEYERRLADPKTTGLLARIAQDRARRPDVYAALAHRFLETLEKGPGFQGGPNGPTSQVPPHSPSLGKDDLRPDLRLPWLWLWLAPERPGASPGHRLNELTALFNYGGADAAEAVRLQIEETFHSALDSVLLEIAQQRYLSDALSLPEGSGLPVVLDMVPRIRVARAAREAREGARDPLTEALKLWFVTPEEKLTTLREVERLSRTEKNPKRLEVLRRLQQAASNGQPSRSP